MMVLPPSYSAMANGLGNHHRWQNRTSGGNVPAWAVLAPMLQAKGGQGRLPHRPSPAPLTSNTPVGRGRTGQVVVMSRPGQVLAPMLQAEGGQGRLPHRTSPAPLTSSTPVGLRSRSIQLQRHRLLRCHHLLHRVFALPAEPPPDRLQRWRGRCGYQRRLGHRWAKNVHAGQTRRGDGRAAGGGEVARTAPNKIPP